ncbi:MAG TPA: hypothetical protein VGE27_02380 [Gemmatimonas sp.]
MCASLTSTQARLGWLPLLLATGLAACAGGSSGPTPAPDARPIAAVGSAVPSTADASQAQLRWPVRTLSHVDLWFHAFAMVSVDTGTVVPLYRRGYRDSITVQKNQRNVLTALDGNRETLARGLQRGGYLSAQFLAFDYASWEEMRGTIERFLQLEGDPRRASDEVSARRMMQLAALFRTATDREWLRLFISGVQDEAVRYFDAEYLRVFRERRAVITAVDSLWQQQYRAKFERFLNNTGQRQGDLLLSLPMGGEGRTGPGRTQRTMMAVPFPARPEDAVQALYVLVHEATGSLVGPVVADNVTPAEQRTGAADRAVASGQVVAGAMVLTKIAPELLAGYQRYYLAQSGVRVDAAADGAALTAAFERAFSLPASMRDALRRQIDIVLGGI